MSVIDVIAERAAVLALERLAERRDCDGSPWLYGAAAAAGYLGWPVQRVYKHLRELPHAKHGNSLMFHRMELDAWVESRRRR